MKYTIELTSKQKAQMDCMIDIVHRYVGFNPKLEPIENVWKRELEKAYKNGLEDGNKIADKDLKEIQDSTYDVAYNKALEDVNHAIDVLKGMTGTECAEWFNGYVGVDNVLCEFNIERLLEGTKAYEEKKKAEDMIECGDEVKILKSGITGIVFAIKGGGYEILSSDAKWNKLLEHQIKKTGRNFKTEVTQLLHKLRGEEK